MVIANGQFNHLQAVLCVYICFNIHTVSDPSVMGKRSTNYIYA